MIWTVLSVAGGGILVTCFLLALAYMLAVSQDLNRVENRITDEKSVRVREIQELRRQHKEALSQIRYRLRETERKLRVKDAVH